ncbi:hypothetical protein Rt10032_c15g5561 [Rhodotorula toruloides]|uniref:Uncharacterized protein n=1 Tax=Rhodotorula toruloides TaxID=5286 RepID=A0A511KPT9_RHOTO|nr:hypothetical protein Rt10032_c15g5561 [Rhodotorula toruloides]
MPPLAEEQLASPSPNSSPESRPAIRLVTTTSSPPASPSPSSRRSDHTEPRSRRRWTSLLARTSLNSASGSGSTPGPVPRESETTLVHRRSFSEALSAAFDWTRAAGSASELAHATGPPPLPSLPPIPSRELPLDVLVPNLSDPKPRNVKKTQSLDLCRRASTLFHPAPSSALHKPLQTIGTPHKTRSTPHKKRVVGKEKDEGKARGSVRRWVKEKVGKAKQGLGKIRRGARAERNHGDTGVDATNGAGHNEEGWENEEDTEVQGTAQNRVQVTTRSTKRPRVSGPSTIRQRDSVGRGGDVSSPFSPPTRGRNGYPANLSASVSGRSTLRRDHLPSSSRSTHSFRFVATSARKRQRVKCSSLSTSTTSYSRFVEIPRREGSVLERPRPVERSEALRMGMSLTSLRSSLEWSTSSRVVSVAGPNASARMEEALGEVDDEDPLKGLFGSSDDERFPTPSIDHASHAPPFDRSRFNRSAAPSPASIAGSRRISHVPASLNVGDSAGTASALRKIRLERTKATRRAKRNDVLPRFSPIDVPKSSVSGTDRRHHRSSFGRTQSAILIDLGSNTKTIQDLTQVIDGDFKRATWVEEFDEQDEDGWTSADEVDDFGRPEASRFANYRDFATPTVSRHGDAGSTTNEEVESPYKDAPEDDSILFTSLASLDFPNLDSESETDVASVLVVPARRLSKEVVRKGSLADLANARLVPSPTSASPTESRYQISPIQPISPFKFGSPFKKVGDPIHVHGEKVRLRNISGTWSPRAQHFDTSLTYSSSSATRTPVSDQRLSSATIRTHSSPTPAPPSGPTALTLSPSSTLNAALLKKTAAIVFATPPGARSVEDGLKSTVRLGLPDSNAEASSAGEEQERWRIYEDQESALEGETSREGKVLSASSRAEKAARMTAAVPGTSFTDKENFVGGTR